MFLLGFRSRVFSLVQKQDTLSVDTEFTIPLGTEFKYTSSCVYDSVSKELVSEFDYSEALSNEADMSSSESSYSSTSTMKNKSVKFGLSSVFPIKGLFGSLGLNYNYDGSTETSSSNSRSQAFSKSQKYASFTSRSVSESVSKHITVLALLRIFIL